MKQKLKEFLVAVVPLWFFIILTVGCDRGPVKVVKAFYPGQAVWGIMSGTWNTEPGYLLAEDGSKCHVSYRDEFGRGLVGQFVQCPWQSAEEIK